MKNTERDVKQFILRRCTQPKQERDIIANAAIKYRLSRNIITQHIRNLKQEGLLYAPKKNVLRKV